MPHVAINLSSKCNNLLCPNFWCLFFYLFQEDGTIVEVDTASLLAAGGHNDGSSLQLQIDDSLLQQFQVCRVYSPMS